MLRAQVGRQPFVDRFGHFDLLPPPTADFSAEAVALHRAVTERHYAVIYAGSDRRPAVG